MMNIRECQKLYSIMASLSDLLLLEKETLRSGHIKNLQVILEEKTFLCSAMMRYAHIIKIVAKQDNSVIIGIPEDLYKNMVVILHELTARLKENYKILENKLNILNKMIEATKRSAVISHQEFALYDEYGKDIDSTKKFGFRSLSFNNKI